MREMSASSLATGSFSRPASPRQGRTVLRNWLQTAQALTTRRAGQQVAALRSWQYKAHFESQKHTLNLIPIPMIVIHVTAGRPRCTRRRCQTAKV